MYLISIILVESLAGVRLMGVCLEALRFFNLGWHGRDALKADSTYRQPHTVHTQTL